MTYSLPAFWSLRGRGDSLPASRRRGGNELERGGESGFFWKTNSFCVKKRRDMFWAAGGTFVAGDYRQSPP